MKLAKFFGLVILFSTAVTAHAVPGDAEAGKSAPPSVRKADPCQSAISARRDEEFLGLLDEHLLKLFSREKFGLPYDDARIRDQILNRLVVIKERDRRFQTSIRAEFNQLEDNALFERMEELASLIHRLVRAMAPVQVRVERGLIKLEKLTDSEQRKITFLAAFNTDLRTPVGQLTWRALNETPALNAWVQARSPLGLQERVELEEVQELIPYYRLGLFFSPPGEPFRALTRLDQILSQGLTP